MPIFRFRTYSAAYAAQQMALGMIRYAGHLSEPDRAARLHKADPERPCILELGIDPDSPLASQIAQRLEDAPDPTPLEVARRTLQVIRRGWRRYGDDDPPRQVDPYGNEAASRTLTEAFERAWCELTAYAPSNTHWLPSAGAAFAEIEKRCDTSAYHYEDTNVTSLFDAWNEDPATRQEDIARLLEAVIERLERDPRADP